MEPLIELGIDEGLFDKGLTVVESAVYLYRRDIPSERGELALLYRADLTPGVEHLDLHTVDT